MKQKRILFLEHNTDGTVGGSHYCLLSICRHLDRQAWVPIVSFYQDNPLVPRFREISVDVQILEPFRPLIFVRTNRILSYFQSVTNFLRMVLLRPIYWARVLRHNRIDLVHLNNSSTADIDLVIAAKIVGVSITAHQRGYPPWFGRLERKAAGSLNKIIAVSNSVRDHLVQLGIPHERIAMIHDGIELGRLAQVTPVEKLRAEFGLLKDELVVGMLGNVKEWKGQKLLLEAIPTIHESFRNTRFLFVGELADELYLRSLKRQLDKDGTSESVIFTGYRPDATDVIAVMDVVVHASIQPEPFGLVVLEAMGKGKPVVASDRGGPRETVRHGVTGLLFESGSSVSLAGAVCVFLENASIRSAAGAEGRKHVFAHFGAELNAARVQAVFSEACN